MGALPFACPVVRDQRVQQRVALPRYPTVRDLPGEHEIGHFFVLEYFVDYATGDLRRDPLRTKLRREARPAAWAVPKPVPHERGGDRGVIEQSPLFEPVQTPVDADPIESLRSELSPELAPGARPVGQLNEGGVTDANVGVEVEQGTPALAGKRIAHTDPGSLEGFERDRYRVTPVEVQPYLEPVSTEVLDAEERGRLRHCAPPPAKAASIACFNS
jgi:hypothetical protein